MLANVISECRESSNEGVALPFEIFDVTLNLHKGEPKWPRLGYGLGIRKRLAQRLDQLGGPVAHG